MTFFKMQPKKIFMRKKSFNWPHDKEIMTKSLIGAYAYLFFMMSANFSIWCNIKKMKYISVKLLCKDHLEM